MLYVRISTIWFIVDVLAIACGRSKVIVCNIEGSPRYL